MALEERSALSPEYFNDRRASMIRFGHSLFFGFFAAALMGCQNASEQSEMTLDSYIRSEIDAETGQPLEQMLRGVIVDANGDPLRARIHLVTSNGSLSSGTLPDGRFQFFDLRAEVYSITVTTKDARIAVLPDVEVSSTPLRITVEDRGSRLMLAASGKPGTRFAVSQGETNLFNFTNRDGKEVALVIPLGEVKVRLYGDEFSEERTIDSAPNQETRIYFEYND